MILDLPGDFRIITALQACGDWLTPIMKFFTWLGYPQAYMLIIAVIYWSIDRKLGLRLGLYLPLLASLNSLLKQAFHAPRPYWLNPEINTPLVSNGFGMPSGHAQAATVWLYAAYHLKKRGGWFVAVFLVLMIGVSRAYLGVHFPSQVVAGWMTGIALLVIVVRAEHRVISWFLKQQFTAQLLLLTGSTLLILVLGILIGWLWRNWEIPLEWIRNSEQKLGDPGESILTSVGLGAVAGNAGGFLGVSLGALLYHRKGWFSCGGRLWKRIIRSLGGLLMLFGLFLLLLWISPEESSILWYPVWRFGGFFLLAISTVYGIPRIFSRIQWLEG
jgi:membrane-associated phospholipid phosphatase